MKLEKRTAIITGAASGGMGAAMCLLFAAEGARIVIGDNNAELGEAGAQEILKAGGEAVFCCTDVRIDADCERLIECAVKKYGSVDILVNAAGIIRFEKFGEVNRDTLMEQFDVNLAGLLMMTQLASARMVAQGRGGAILNIASIAGRRGEPEGPAYAATKAAVISINQASALALARHGIRVNALAPGFTRSKMWSEIERRHLGADGSSDAFNEMMGKLVPLGGFGEPLDMARAALFMVSDDSRYITGQTLNIDGGLVTN